MLTGAPESENAPGRSDERLSIELTYDGIINSTDQYNHAATLKSANVVVRDNKGNVIPLSKRFDLSQGKRLGNIQFSKAEGGVEPVSEQEAAMRDALIDLLREAGIEIVTDNAEAQRELGYANEALKLMSKYKKTSQEAVVPGEETPFKATVVSSDAGAKILQNLEKLAKDYENKSNRPRTF